MRHLSLVTVLFSLVACFNSAVASNQRIALVIGNASYSDLPLDNPVNDARAISAKLQSLDFEVIELTNASLKDMQRGLVTFTSRIESGATALVYYAGHGIQANGRNYLLPVDASASNEASLRFEALQMGDILEELGHSNARINLVVLDACRNNPFERKFRGGGRGLAVVDAAAGTLIAYATAPGQVAADGEGQNSTYTQALLKALDEPGLKVEEVFKQVRIDVSRASGGAQVPWESSSLTGDFVFNDSAPAQASPLVSGSEPVHQETQLWSGIAESNNPADFETYLSQYPEGTFRAVAEQRLSELRKPRSCDDLTGTWHATYEGATCLDRITIAPTRGDSYPITYQTCGAVAAVSGIAGLGTFDDPLLTYRWTSFPCGGVTEIEFNADCSAGIGRNVSRSGLPGVCHVFVPKGKVFTVTPADPGA